MGLRVLNRLSPAPAAIVAFAALPVTASAHPHVFADTEIGFAFDDDGTVTSLRVKWTYDEFTTLTLYDILGLDSDGDGALDDSDFAKIVEGETNWPPGYKGDLHLSGPEDGPRLTRPGNAVPGLLEGRAWAAFDLPRSQPFRIEDQDLKISI